MGTVQTLALPPGDVPAAFDHGAIFFVGTATVVLRHAGFTILTDPNFLHRHESLQLGYGLLRSRRLTEPALTIDKLPPIDCIILSHLHEDHFDRVAVRDLDKRLPIITTGQAAKGLAKEGFGITHALPPWESLTVTKGEGRLRITAMPGIHAPGPLARLLPPVMGGMREFARAEGSDTFRLYITGDTLLHDQLALIPQRYPDIDVALLHLGEMRVLGLLVTMDARQGARHSG